MIKKMKIEETGAKLFQVLGRFEETGPKLLVHPQTDLYEYRR